MTIHQLPTSGTYYRHQDGGLYKVDRVSRSTVDQTLWVVYDHVYPFEPMTWHRPLLEWTPERFSPITEGDVAHELATTDQVQRQKQITAMKETRKSTR